MDESKIIRRKIFLKKQAAALIIEEIRDLQNRLALLRLKGCLESRIENGKGDSALSRKIDCINFLLEN